MKNLGMTAAVAMAAGFSEDEAKSVAINADFMKKYFPDVAAALHTEGAVAETARIAGIEACAVDGVDHVIKAHKADRSKTPGDCALAVIQEQQKPEFKAQAALKADEEKVKGLRSDTANPTVPEKKAATTLEGDEKYKAEWATGKPKSEGFTDEKTYLAQRRAEDRGAVKVLNTRTAA